MSDMILPVIVPVNTSPTLCPECGRPENKKIVCRHCDYEYVEEPTTRLEISIGVIFLCIIIWLLVTGIYWFVDNGEFGDHQTLFQIIAGQWEWLKTLRIW